MALKIINAILILFAVFMGLKQGWAMLSGNTKMLEMFGKWELSKTSVAVLGAITLIGSVLVLFPKTFLWGNFIMAATILFIITLQLSSKDLEGVAKELPFFLLSWLIIYLQHPLYAHAR